MNESKKYIFWIDLVRVICMMWIVFVWHLKDYLPGEYQMFGSILKVSQWITVTALFAFTLLSGYSMAKYKFQSFKDVLSFYKKRLIRFYPLYLVAILCFWWFGWYSSVTVIKCMTGIALFFNEAPLTLWYMCMLMFFYMITPIINWEYGSYKNNFYKLNIENENLKSQINQDKEVLNRINQINSDLQSVIVKQRKYLNLLFVAQFVWLFVLLFLLFAF